MRKPETCKGCPLYGDGEGFVPGIYPDNAEILILGQNPGEEEERIGRPFVGKTGQWQAREFLPLAGLKEEEVALDNTIRCRQTIMTRGGKTKHTNTLPKLHQAAINHCSQYDKPHDKFKVIAATGAVALSKFEPDLKLHEWRGYFIPSPYNIFCTRHTAELFRNPGNIEITKIDWLRLGQYLRGEWPSQLPPSIKCTDILSDNAINWLQRAAKEPYIVVDTEYDPTSSRLWMIGLLCPNIGALQMTWPNDKSAWVSKQLRSLFSNVTTWWHNAKADHNVLWSALAMHPRDYAEVFDTMLAHAALWCELPHDLEFVASIMGKYPKLKHLMKDNPFLYNLGDIAETEAIGIALQKSLTRDKQVNKVFQQYTIPLIPTIVEAETRGIRIDREKAYIAQKMLTHRIDTATNIAGAYTGFPINIGSSKQLTAYLSSDLHKNISSIDEDTIANLRAAILPFDPQEESTEANLLRRIEEGGHPVIESRVVYANAQQTLTHYIRPILESKDGRIYPRFNIWAQNTGRWSTVDPPIAQIPTDLLNLLIPDDRETWITWDWDQIELRLVAVLAKDNLLMEVFDKGWDPHTINMCDIFGFPYPQRRTKKEIATHPENKNWRDSINWKGNDDPRRVFAKRFVYRLLYGGRPEAAHSIPGASSLQMDKDTLVKASYRWIRIHAAVRRYWSRIKHDDLPLREIRTFTGRLWRFLGRNKSRTLRQMYDFGMQGGVSDILNKTIIDIMKALMYKGGRIVYTRHDSGTIGIPTNHLKYAQEIITKAVEQPWKIEGKTIIFPATYKIKG